MWVEEDDLTAGAARVLQQRGLAGKIPVVSMDGDPSTGVHEGGGHRSTEPARATRDEHPDALGTELRQVAHSGDTSPQRAHGSSAMSVPLTNLLIASVTMIAVIGVFIALATWWSVLALGDR